MKRLFCCFMALSLLLGMSACGESSAAPFGYAPLKSLPADYDAAQAESAGDTVFGAGGIKNGEGFEQFLNMVSLGTPAGVRLTSFTVEGDPIIYDLEFNGSYFILQSDSTRDSFGVREIVTSIYSYIVTNGSGIYLSNCVSYDAAAACLYGLERGTLLLTPKAEKSWCSAVSEISEACIARGDDTMRVWSSDGTRCCGVSGTGGFAYSAEGYASAQSLPTGSYLGLKSAVGAAWIDESSFVIAAELENDPVFSYAFLVYDVSDAENVRLSEAFSGNGYTISSGRLVISG